MSPTEPVAYHNSYFGAGYGPILYSSDGEIRLVGGSTNLEGTVEICFGNLWGLIAESGWGDQDAAATCRQLGFLGEGKYCIVL